MLNTDKIFNVDYQNFDQIAFEVFKFQYKNNTVYKSYCDLLKNTIKDAEKFIKDADVKKDKPLKPESKKN